MNDLFTFFETDTKSGAGTKVLASQLFLDCAKDADVVEWAHYADFISFNSPTQLAVESGTDEIEFQMERITGFSDSLLND